MSGFGLLSLQRVSALLIALAIPFAFGSCQSIAGIDDRELGPCGHYCDVVMANCKDENAQYETRKKCLGVCEFYTVGDDVEWQGKDTLQCRLHEAALAASAGEDQRLYCLAAGPEGFDCGTAAACSCGGSCNSYCSLYKTICGTVQCNGSQQDCVTACEGLRDTGGYDVIADASGNTLQCRFVHLTNATVEPNGGHCGHAQLIAPTDVCVDGSSGGDEYGAGGADGEPDSGAMSGAAHASKLADPTCDEYCRVEMFACTNENAQYENNDECTSVCNTFETGEFGAASANTLGCRIYHANNALCGPVAHCPHSGPGGEGVCGANPVDKCDSYCTLAQQACPASFAAKYPNKGDCQADCATLPDAAPGGATAYTVTYARTRGTLACRLLAASQAAVDSSLCTGPPSGIFGEGVCAAE